MDDDALTIVIVDDQPMVAAAIHAALRAGGVSARLITHGSIDSACDVARRAKPDLILQDLVLPSGNGMELLELYAADPELAHVPVLVLSANDDAQTKAEAFARGAADYLVKLPPSVELVARLRAHARAGRAARERDAALAQLDDLNRLLSIANEALAGEARESRERLTSAQKLGAQLLEIQDFDVLVDRILAEAARTAHADATAIFVRDGERLILEHALVPSRPLERIQHVHLSMMSAGFVGTTARTGGLQHRRGDREGGPLVEAAIVAALGVAAGAAIAVPLASSTVAQGAALGVLLLINADARAGFSDDQLRQIKHLGVMATLALERARMVRAMILRMVAMAELRDPHETGAHVRRVAGFSVALFDTWARREKLAAADTQHMRDQLYISALLHDVGKVGIPDAILNKPGRLDPAERATMERHTEIGAGLFRGLRTGFDDAAREVALGHHERWDGLGYPGLAQAGARHPRKGTDIPLFARIVAIADVYDALSSPRTYKNAWPESEVVAYLRNEAGKHFDPELVDAAIDSLPALRRVQRRFADAVSITVAGPPS
ncbi:MAG: HD domain-containing protein [Phycisphaerae bacterium]|nr:HD domain-containing protein [Phycisphaerae bacterium]